MTDEKLPEIVPPNFVEIETREFFDYDAEVVDYEHLRDVNRTINRARHALFKVVQQINEYERLEAEKKDLYDKKHRRAYLTSTERTDAARRARADLYTEDLENDWIACKQAKNELSRIANTLREDLRSLQGLSHNIRQQLKM